VEIHLTRKTNQLKMSSSKVLIHVNDEALRKETIATLNASCPDVLFDERQVQWNTLLEEIGRTRPDAVLMDYASLTSDPANAIKQLKAQHPRTKVIAMHGTADPKIILAAMRAGANEFLHPPLEDSLPAALERILSSGDQDETPPARGRIIGFLSAKGGCGATTIACHIASEIQTQTRKSVLLADLDLISGLVGFLMKAPSSYSILDAIKNLSRLDESLWRALVVEHRPGLSVIPAPAVYTRWDQPEDDQMRRVLQFMRKQHEWTVLDLGRSLNPTALAVLEEIDQLFLVSTLEVVALHGLKTIVHGLFEQGEKLQLILNRTPKMMDISTEDLEKILGRSLYAALPNDYMGLYQSYSSGNLLNSNSRLAQDFALLASKITGVPPIKSKKKFAFFG
jgi:pilus assembly protein CpaE